MSRRRRPEDAFQDAVIEAAHLNRWTVAHFRTVRVQRADGSTYHATPVQADGQGFPDLILVRDRIVAAELKAPRGTLRDDQRVWLDRLAIAGVETYLWRPRDWPIIEQVLAVRPRDLPRAQQTRWAPAG